MRIKIISNGKPWGTRVIDLDSGQVIEMVKRAIITTDADDNGGMPVAVLTVLATELEVECEASVEKELLQQTEKEAASA
jgi:hypothetical protein